MMTFKFLRVSISLLIFLVPLSHVGDLDNPYVMNALISVPIFWVLTSKVLLYSFYLLAMLLFIRSGLENRVSLTRVTIPFITAFLIMFVVSVAQMEDVNRYALLLISSLSVPTLICTIYKVGEFDMLIANIKKISSLFVLVSFIICIVNFNPSFRFTGMVGNPNIFSACIFSCLVMLMLPKLGGRTDDTTIYELACFYIGLLLIVFSGSRSALFATTILFLFQAKSLKTLILCVIGLIVGVLIINNVPSDFVVDRLISTSNGYMSLSKTSGRADLWSDAAILIGKEPILGAGMRDTLYILGSGNVHNSYLRILSMVGMPLGFLIIAFILLGVITLIVVNIPVVIKVYSFSLLVFLSGEDFIVGIGSAFLFYFFIIISLAQVYFLSRSL